MAQQVKNLLATQETQERQPSQVFLPQKSHGQWSLVCYSPWVATSRIRLMQLSTHTHTGTITNTEIGSKFRNRL